MNVIKALMTASFISMLFALLIGGIAYMDGQQMSTAEREEQPVTQSVQPMVLTEDAVVDFLINIPLFHQFEKVKLEHQHLFIDVGVQNQYTSDQVYQDAYTFVEHVYRQTTNIEDLYVRFLSTVDEEKVLLVAVNSERHGALMEGLESDEQHDPRLFLKQYTQIIYGTGWRN